ncbi:hypothetical protein GCM10010429_31810 [Micromonospora olivasterospora]
MTSRPARPGLPARAPSRSLAQWVEGAACPRGPGRRGKRMETDHGGVEYALATAGEDDDPESLIGEPIGDEPHADEEE